VWFLEHTLQSLPHRIFLHPDSCVRHNPIMIWHERGGSGPRTILLLHGLGATGAVWNGVRRLIEERGLGEWIAADLSGHGHSDARAHYSVGTLAADAAELVHTSSDLYVVGHSLGVYVGLALASRWFGVTVAGLVGIGPKITWTEAEVRNARELAARPVRWFSSESEAWARYRRVSGLETAIAPESAWLTRGVVQAAEGWRLSQDPRTFAVAGAPFATLVASAAARVVLARGEGDAMVTTAELRAHCADAHEIAGAGHNAHVEKPEAIVALLERVISQG